MHQNAARRLPTLSWHRFPRRASAGGAGNGVYTPPEPRTPTHHGRRHRKVDITSIGGHAALLHQRAVRPGPGSP